MSGRSPERPAVEHRRVSDQLGYSRYNPDRQIKGTPQRDPSDSGGMTDGCAPIPSVPAKTAMPPAITGPQPARQRGVRNPE